MLLEIIIVLQIIAFLFLLVGIIPTAKTTDFEGNENKPPYLNKIIFVLVAGILFAMLGITTTTYDYNYCYINQTSADYQLNTTSTTATCDSYRVESIGLAYLNYGMTFISFVIGLILMIFAGTSKELYGGN